MNGSLEFGRKVFFAILFLALAAFVGVRLFYLNKQPQLPVLGTVPTFHLTAQDRRSFTKDELLGKVNIIDFIFTTCAGPCPLMSAQMQSIQSKVENEHGIALVSFTVDPEADTPEVLTEYAKRFGAMPERWTFLTGSKTDIYTLTRYGFKLAIDADSNAIAHSTKFVLVDKEANIRGYYDSEDQESINRLLDHAVALVKE